MNTLFLFLAGAALLVPPEVTLRVAERLMLPCDIEKLSVVERGSRPSVLRSAIGYSAIEWCSSLTRKKRQVWPLYFVSSVSRMPITSV